MAYLNCDLGEMVGLNQTALRAYMLSKYHVYSTLETGKATEM